MVAATPGFRTRAGQREMAQCVAQTLATADLGEHDAPTKAIAVIQAGTGVGKSAAYAVPAIALALERKVRVIISTATVALQEQLIGKDLPALAKSFDQPFVFALAKGRNRYVCKLKLERLAGNAQDGVLFEGDPAPASSIHKDSGLSEEAQLAYRQKLFEGMIHDLAHGHWDGDRDSLMEAPNAHDWSLVAAERHTCTVRHCPHFRGCSYYEARSRLVDANVIVANHDLVLASLGMKSLPDLDKCLVVFDEGHHLPAVALDQFGSHMDLSNLRWLDRLPKTLQDVAGSLLLSLQDDVQSVSSSLKTNLTALARMALDTVGSEAGRHPRGEGQLVQFRLAKGQLPDAWEPVVLEIGALARTLMKSWDTLGTQIKTIAKEDPSQAAACALHYAQMGSLVPRLSSVVSTVELLLEHGEQPLAKWVEVDSASGFLTVTAHACPIVPGDLLRQFLWSQVRGAIITSASLTSCGSFDFFLREAGLANTKHVTTLEVSSPFDYAKQGTLAVVPTQADPKHAASYTAEMVVRLMQDIEHITHGALVLFTSRAQMQVAIEAIPGHLLDIILIQGQQPRSRLLTKHAQRVEAGLPSVLFGLQSFGEGLDLPGRLCETVFIAKLPFAPPTAPVDEARAEWLRTLGRDPFQELVIPATGIKLLQWTGRAIRTEDDVAHVICYDKRLTKQPYGRRMLAGLPPYRLLA